MLPDAFSWTITRGGWPKTQSSCWPLVEMSLRSPGRRPGWHPCITCSITFVGNGGSKGKPARFPGHFQAAVKASICLIWPLMLHCPPSKDSCFVVLQECQSRLRVKRKTRRRLSSLPWRPALSPPVSLPFKKFTTSEVSSCLWLPTNIRPCLVNSAASCGRIRASDMSQDVKWIGVIAVLNANLLAYTHRLYKNAAPFLHDIACSGLIYSGARRLIKVENWVIIALSSWDIRCWSFSQDETPPCWGL